MKNKYWIGIVALFIAAILCMPMIGVSASPIKENPPKHSFIKYNPPKPSFIKFNQPNDLIAYAYFPIWLINNVK
jgi:hypothetical protein